MRFKCICSYDGTLFHGFQIQGSLRTVQFEIESVLLIIAKRKIRFTLLDVLIAVFML